MRNGEAIKLDTYICCYCLYPFYEYILLIMLLLYCLCFTLLLLRPNFFLLFGSFVSYFCFSTKGMPLCSDNTDVHHFLSVSFVFIGLFEQQCYSTSVHQQIRTTKKTQVTTVFATACVINVFFDR